MAGFGTKSDENCLQFGLLGPILLKLDPMDIWYLMEREEYALRYGLDWLFERD